MNASIRTLPVGLLIALVITGCGRHAPDAPGARDYQVAEATRVDHQGSFLIRRELAGLVVPRQSTDIGFELGGEIVSIAVDEGERVEPGEVVARLDTQLLLTERDELVAQQLDLEAQLELNRTNTRRAKDLQAKGFTSDQRIDELTAQEQSLLARLKRVQAGLAATAERLHKSELSVPFSGTVTRRFVDEGAVINAGQPVLRIIENDTLEARIGVPVRLHDRFPVGGKVTILAAGTEVEGTVLAVSREVTRATLTVPVRIALSATGAVPGDQAYLVYEEQVVQDGFWVPATALTEGIRGLWNVYAMVPEAEDNLFRIEARDVKIRYFDDTRAYVDGAVEHGEWLVAGGLQRLVPGQRVIANTKTSADGDAGGGYVETAAP